MTCALTRSRSPSDPPMVPPPIAHPTRPRLGRTRYKHSAPPTEVSQGETRPPDRPGDDHRAALGREVFHRDLAHAVLFQPADDLRIPLEEPHAEPVVLHAMELRRDLRVPFEGDNERPDLVVLPVPDLVRMKRVRLQAVELLADRARRLREVPAVPARGGRRHRGRRIAGE